jgi:hypothetical protein
MVPDALRIEEPMATAPTFIRHGGGKTRRAPHRPSWIASVLTAVAALLLPLGVLAQTLNDTAQITCYDASVSTGTVAPATPDPEPAGFDEQDCTRGAAAADALGAMVKAGASTTSGRDYSKIANDGSELPASATLGSAPGDWACTRDNVTGLIWEVKVSDVAQLRHFNHTYSWFDSDGTQNGGNAGTLGGGLCNATLPNCNTTALRDAVNALPGGLCGASDWRMPTPQELQGLLHYGLASAALIDQTWFPNTASATYYTGRTQASGAGVGVAVVSFSVGDVPFTTKNNLLHVRLVRGGP